MNVCVHDNKLSKSKAKDHGKDPTWIIATRIKYYESIMVLLIASTVLKYLLLIARILQL